MLIIAFIALIAIMAMCATLPAATVMVRTGLLTSGSLATASALSDKFANNGKQYLLVKNGDTGAHVLTFSSAATVDGLAIADPTVTLAAGETRLIGPFKPSVFNDSDGYITVASDVITSQTVLVLQADTVVNQ